MRISTNSSCSLPTFFRTLASAWTVLAWGSLLVTADLLVASESVEFDRDVRPILKAHCSHCHGEEPELAGGLDVRLRRTLVAGGDSGPAVAPQDPQHSLLLERIVADEMPPEEVEKRLTSGEVAVLREWIRQGAPVQREEPEALPLGPWISPLERQFWSFQPIQAAPIPTVRGSERVRQPVDAFVLARLEAAGRSLAADAPREMWLRRVTIDLTGLAPTPDEVAAFVADSRPGAEQRQVDRLLASPAFGERWGRHWLDVAGYSDSEGRVKDPQRSNAWKYRDFVIQSWNRGLPYDQFLTWQLAGDELVEQPYSELEGDDLQRLTATGFLRMAADGSAAAGVSAEDHNQVIADTMQIVGTSILGLTVHCAQCHNHRYDPIPQKDYYQLRAVFDPAFDWKRWKNPKQRRVSLYSDADRKRAAEIEKQAKQIDAQRTKEQKAHIERVLKQELDKLEPDTRQAVQQVLDVPAKKRSAEQKKLLAKYPSVNVTASSLYLYDRKASDSLKALAKKAADLRATKPKEEFLRVLTEAADSATESFVMIRGDHEQPGEPASPQGLTVLGGPAIPERDSDLSTSGRRLAYARWITSRDHPLTARVAVNRIWMHLFGRGLVETPADFGQLGRRPSHPLLLDFLASELQRGWHVKPLLRQMVLSTTYRQTSQVAPAPDDPENRLFGAMPLRRLDAESVRDLMLQAADSLNREAGGAPVPVMADRVGQFVIGKENLNAGRPGPVIPMKGQEYRRSVYIESRRSRPLAVLDAFDLPAMAPNCDCRDASTVATQALLLMNSDFAEKISERCADSVLQAAGGKNAEAVRVAWQRAFGTEPDASQLAALQSRMQQLESAFQQRLERSDPKRKPAQRQQAAQRQALATICQALISSNRFLYIQ